MSETSSSFRQQILETKLPFEQKDQQQDFQEIDQVIKKQFEEQFKMVSQQLENTKDMLIQGQQKVQYDSVWTLVVLDTEENSLYTVKRFYIAEEKKEREKIISQQMLNLAKKEGQSLKDCYDPKSNLKTIIQYYDEFLMYPNYYIIMENCPYNLKQFMDNPNCQLEPGFKNYQLISFAHRIISALNQISNQNNKQTNSKKYTLKNRQIESILVDNLNQIKLCDFQSVEDFINEISHKPEEQNFYYPPECGRSDTSKDCLESLKADSWTFGIYFYLLAGGSEADCYQIRNSGYKKLYALDDNLNSILSKILCLNWQQRLSTKDIQAEFENLLKQYEQIKDQFADQVYQRFEYYKTNNKQLAYRYITICTQILPDDEKYIYQQGFIQDDLKLYEEAIQSFEKCIKLSKQKGKNDKIDNYYYNLAIAQKNQKLLDEAINSYLSAIKIDSKKAIYHYKLGIAYVENGDLQKGIKSFTTCQELDKEKKYHCHYNIGLAHSEKGEWDKAIKEFSLHIKDIAADSEKHECYYNMGNACYEKRQYEKAIQNYREAIQRYQDPKYYYNLGMALMLNKVIFEAISEFENCRYRLQDKNTLHPVYEQLAICYKKDKQFHKAIELYKLCIELDKNEYSYLIDLGVVYEENQDYAEAIKTYGLYLDKYPQDKSIQRKQKNAENKLNKIKRCFFW
ncbi:tetratricopeptide repeat protein (macronuclear) [Tetrahymena thermophila SB210]|uniref:Tetratricopeptide repeat protein n=1 Tax=Tetrahymena thermophila (strain SB210) TaxID=312017 RepID=A4VDM8_TETTS|nr:tetratricopeptide repeat protein [Tetrahymena thermophila SB210]EDK31625.2 tetratricopeptide repeat protein [Tetrahymena thermophila SB210]|eukprot:XP_001471385.2 tetratricopeptide repeat protein [Tetrahymena thermophila SB210]